jgi:hypothetical protein
MRGKNTSLAGVLCDEIWFMIVGVMGLMGSGKDTLSDVLVNEHNFTKLSFADTVKDVVSCVFGWDRELVEGSTKESRDFREVVDLWWSKELGIPNLTPRMALQLVGTELFRDHFDNDIWVKNTMRRASLHQNVVIADVRFRNEAEAIAAVGGKLVRVIRGANPSWYQDATMASEGHHIANLWMSHCHPEVHRSEWDCLCIDENITLRNDSTLEKFRLEANRVINEAS